MPTVLGCLVIAAGLLLGSRSGIRSPVTGGGGRPARRPRRAQVDHLRGVPRRGRQQPLERHADHRRARRGVLQEADRGLRGGQAPLGRDGALRQAGAATWAWTTSRPTSPRAGASPRRCRRPPTRWRAGAARPPSARSATGPRARATRPSGIPSLAGQAPGYLREQMLLFKQDRRSPGDPALAAVKALLKTIPDETFADLAAYYSSLR